MVSSPAVKTDEMPKPRLSIPNADTIKIEEDDDRYFELPVKKKTYVAK